MERVTHPRFQSASWKVARLRRYIPHADAKDLARYRSEFDHHVHECNDERQAVLMVDSLIEQNRPLRW